MSSVLAALGGKGTFARGVHPPEQKLFSAGSPIDVLPAPETVVLPLSQHIGAPCQAAVKTKTEVQAGVLLGQAGGFVSAPLHASLNGKVKKSVNVTLPTGRRVSALPIEAEGEDNDKNSRALFAELTSDDWDTDAINRMDPQTIIDTISEAGIVGLGGAAFPAHVKLTPNNEKPVDLLLINGCECEPYLTADYRIMLEASRALVAGALVAARAAGAEKIVIAIEDNKPQAVESVSQAAQGTGIEVVSLKTKYPQGSEKHLIVAVSGRKVPPGKLPLDVGVVVSNVGTACAMACAVLKNRPLTHRVICVTGAGVHQPKNLFVPIGTPYRHLIDYCGGLTTEAVRIISGGPMMGFAFTNLDLPVTKGTSGVTVLIRDDVKKAAETACIRCGRCVDACPMNLVPTKLALAARNQASDVAEAYHIMACIECGCCAFTCPASLPLVQLIRLGKAQATARNA
ncbi:MAG: electron transport complex subunit RsxC [Desulfosudaceae bacterium]